MNNFVILALIILIAALIVAAYIIFKTQSKVTTLESKYSTINDVSKEVEKLELEKLEVAEEIESLREAYKDKKAIFEKLMEEVAIYDEEIELAEYGFYKPHFDFDTSEKHKEEIRRVKQEQKKMVTSKEAIYCNKAWVIEGSKTQGRIMTNNAIKLTSRAFNSECDAAISNTRWNNIERMDQRIIKALGSINKLNESNAIVISSEYYQLKLKELRLVHEYTEKKRKEKEEQQEIRAQMREEARLEAEISKEIKDSLEEEKRYNKLLEKAKKEAEESTGSKLEMLNDKISKLTRELTEAHEKSERAMSMAQQTKRGHVYVISNIGSFGENVYKIGMTRRLEPLDRVKELGDASVPFTFDVHAIIHSEDAPALETALHNKFDQKRLNLVNTRKEFFRVRLSDIEDEVIKINPNAEFIETAEARDFRESQNIFLQRERTETKNASTRFPETI